MEKVRIGTIGCGGIAKGKHLPAEKRNPDAELVAFCDVDIEKAKYARDNFGVEGAEVYTDYKEMLKRDDIDAVLICTPNYLHCQITVDALNAGKHVMCEKPMALNYKEALKMIEARDKNKKVLTIGYQNRYREDVCYLKELCNENYFGDIYYAEANAIRRRGVPTWGVFIDEEKQGGGPLIDIGTHALDLTLYLMNNYKPKYCVGTTYHKLNGQTKPGNVFGDWDPSKFTAEDSAFGFVVMENGATINLRASWALNTTFVREASATLCGDKAGVEIIDDSGKNIEINEILNNRQLTFKPNLSAGKVAFFSGAGGNLREDVEARLFTGKILGKCELIVTAEQAACVTRILDGIYESQKTGKPVFFD